MKNLTISAGLVVLSLTAILTASTPTIKAGNGLYGIYHSTSQSIADTGGVYDRRF